MLQGGLGGVAAGWRILTSLATGSADRVSGIADLDHSGGLGDELSLRITRS